VIQSSQTPGYGPTNHWEKIQDSPKFTSICHIKEGAKQESGTKHEASDAIHLAEA
jgi:hypothetical protein